MFLDIFKKKKLIYSAIGNEDYCRVVGKLQNAGIKYSVKINPNDMRHFGTKKSIIYHDKYQIYDIYVRIENEGKAIKAIHKE